MKPIHPIYVCNQTNCQYSCKGGGIKRGGKNRFARGCQTGGRKEKGGKRKRKGHDRKGIDDLSNRLMCNWPNLNKNQMQKGRERAAVPEHPEHLRASQDRDQVVYSLISVCAT